MQNGSRAQTDENGRFVLERVTPGDARVHWQPAPRAARPTADRYYQPVFLDVLPGQSARADLVQQGGARLIGRVVVPATAGRPVDPKSVNAYILMKVPEVPYPAGLDAEDRRDWYNRWRLTDAGRTYRHRRRSFAHPLYLREDGSFRIDEVQPGTYELEVRVPGCIKLVRDVIVPEPTSRREGAIDLGTLTIERSGDPQASD